MDRQLYRPRKNRVVAGVCSGFGEYFGIDPTIIRIVTIVIMMSGVGLPAYIIAAIIMPDETKIYSGGFNEWKTDTSGAAGTTDDFVREHEKVKDEWEQPVKQNNEKNKIIMGAILVGLGFLFLVKQFLPAFDWKFFIPVLLMGIGGLIILKGRK